MNRYQILYKDKNGFQKNVSVDQDDDGNLKMSSNGYAITIETKEGSKGPVKTVFITPNKGTFKDKKLWYGNYIGKVIDGVMFTDVKETSPASAPVPAPVESVAQQVKPAALPVPDNKGKLVALGLAVLLIYAMVK